VPLRMLFGNWEIGTCIINDAGREAAHKIQWKYTFLVESNLSKCFILMIWRYILTFNAKKITNLTIQYPFKPWALKVYIYICVIKKKLLRLKYQVVCVYYQYNFNHVLFMIVFFSYIVVFNSFNNSCFVLVFNIVLIIHVLFFFLYNVCRMTLSPNNVTWHTTVLPWYANINKSAISLLWNSC
jgi:hypothetical protein